MEHPCDMEIKVWANVFKFVSSSSSKIDKFM